MKRCGTVISHKDRNRQPHHGDPPLLIIDDGRNDFSVDYSNRWMGCASISIRNKNRMNVLLDIRKTGVGLKNAEVRT